MGRRLGSCARVISACQDERDNLFEVDGDADWYEFFLGPSLWSGASPAVGLFPTVYAGQRLNHRESGGTADAPDLGSGARKGVGVRLSPLAPPPTCGSSFLGPDSEVEALVEETR
jgi:hypothetical protein